MPLVKMVRQHTDRNATLIVESSRDPDLAREVIRLQENLDRHVEVVETLGAASELPGSALLLTASDAPGRGALVARSLPYRMKPLPFVDRMLTWYGETIAHRQAGDRLEPATDHCLYELKPKSTP